MRSETLRYALKFVMPAIARMKDADEKSAKYSLSGVYMRRTSGNTLQVVATDGYRLHAISLLDSISFVDLPTRGVVLPTARVGDLLKLKLRSDPNTDDDCSFEIDAISGEAVFRYFGPSEVAYRFRPLASAYPNVDKYLKEPTSVSLLGGVGVDPRYLADAGNAFAALMVKPKVGIRLATHSAGEAIYMALTSLEYVRPWITNATVMLMPMRIAYGV
jgi:hypothetical protein